MQNVGHHLRQDPQGAQNPRYGSLSAHTQKVDVKERPPGPRLLCLDNRGDGIGNVVYGQELISKIL
jgi:hypothetical protein